MTTITSIGSYPGLVELQALTGHLRSGVSEVTTMTRDAHGGLTGLVKRTPAQLEAAGRALIRKLERDTTLDSTGRAMFLVVVADFGEAIGALDDPAAIRQALREAGVTERRET